MNYKWDKKYLYWGVTAFFVIASSCVFFLAIFNFDKVKSGFETISGFMEPVIVGFVLAYLLAPVMNFFEKKCFAKLFTKMSSKKGVEPNTKVKYRVKKLSRGFGVFVTMLLAIGFVTGLLSAVLPQLISSVQHLSNNVTLYITTANNWLLSLFDDNPEIYRSASQMFTEMFEGIKVQLQNMILPQMTTFLANITTSIMTTVSIFFNLILGFIICVYFLYSKELFAAQIKKLLYGITSRKTANLVIRNMRQVHKTFGGYITGKLIDSLLVGILVLIVMTIFNIPYALLISIFIGIMNIIPYFGPIIGAVPSAFLILLVDPFKCLQFIIIIIIIMQFDGYVIEPKILGDNTGLSSFWVIFAILAGGEIFGVVGIVIGVPLFAVAYHLMKGYISRKLTSKGMPTDTNDYRLIAHFDKDTGEAITLEQIKQAEIAAKIIKEEHAKTPKKKRGLFKKK